MNFNKEIDNYIKSLEDKKNIDFLSYFEPIPVIKSLNDYKKIDIDKLIKNIILCQLYDLGEENFINGAKVLKSKNFNEMYESFKNFGFAMVLKHIKLRFKKGVDGFYVEPDYQKIFKNFGIEDKYNESDSFDVKQEIVEKCEKELLDRYIKEIFKENFLCDVFANSDEVEKDFILNIIGCFDQKSVLDNLDVALQEIKNKYPVFDKEAKRWIIKEYVEIDVLNYNINNINSVIGKIRSNEIYFEKNKNSVIKKLKQIKEYLSKEEFDITLLDRIDFELLFKINPKMYLYIFKKFLSLQKTSYDNLKEENVFLKKVRESNDLKEFLKKFNIEYDSLSNDVKILLNKTDNLSNFKMNMKYLEIEQCDEFDLSLASFLINTPHKIVKEYAYYIKSKIVSKNFLLRNLNVFYSEDFKKNCSIIKNNNLSTINSRYDETILLKENIELAKNDELLKLYGRDSSFDNFCYLFDSYNFDLLDFFIENGMDINLLDEFNLTKEEVNNFIKRTIICNNLDISFYTNQKVNTNFLLGNNFYVPDDELDLYIPLNGYFNEELYEYIKAHDRNVINNDINQLDIFNNLEKFKSRDGMFYDIEGIIISRLKVIRNISLFYNSNNINDETVLAAISYNSNLDDYSINIIIENIFGTKRKIKK